jgi:hypothetical protein
MGNSTSLSSVDVSRALVETSDQVRPDFLISLQSVSQQENIATLAAAVEGIQRLAGHQEQVRLDWIEQSLEQEHWQGLITGMHVLLKLQDLTSPGVSVTHGLEFSSDQVAALRQVSRITDSFE